MLFVCALLLETSELAAATSGIAEGNQKRNNNCIWEWQHKKRLIATYDLRNWMFYIFTYSRCSIWMLCVWLTWIILLLLFRNGWYAGLFFFSYMVKCSHSVDAQGKPHDLLECMLNINDYYYCFTGPYTLAIM